MTDTENSMPRRSSDLQNGNPRSLFVLYEPGHVGALESHWHKRPEDNIDALVVALSLDAEMELTKRGIAFASGRSYKQRDPELLMKEDAMIAAFFADPRWSAFAYRGVDLRTTFSFMFRAYLQRVWYYSNLIISVLERHPSVNRISVFAPIGKVSRFAGGLAAREVDAVAERTLSRV